MFRFNNLKKEIDGLKNDIHKKNQINQKHLEDKDTLFKVIDNCENENEILKKEIDALKKDKYPIQQAYEKADEKIKQYLINQNGNENKSLKNNILKLEKALVSSNEDKYLSYQETQMVRSEINCIQEELEITKVKLTNYKRQVAYLEELNRDLKNKIKTSRNIECDNNMSDEYFSGDDNSEDFELL